MPQNFEKTKMQFGFTFSVEVLPKKKTGTRAAGYRLEFKLLPLNIVRKNLKKQLKTCCCDPFVPWLERGARQVVTGKLQSWVSEHAAAHVNEIFTDSLARVKISLLIYARGTPEHLPLHATPTASIYGNRATLRLHGNEVATNDIATYLHRQPLWALTTASTRRR